MNVKSSNCKVCGKKGEYKCSKCGKITYCSRECQFKDWVNHKSSCSSFNNHKKKSPISLNKKVAFSNNTNINDSNIIINQNDKSINDNNNNKITKSRNINSDLKYPNKKKNKSKYSTLYPRNDNNNSKNRNISSTGTNDSGTTNTETLFKEIQTTNEDKKSVPIFDFMHSIREIIFMKNSKKILNDNIDEEDSEYYEHSINNNLNNLNNEKIILIYNLLKENRKHIIEKVLLNSNKSYYFVTNSSLRDKFIEIEKYIFNYIFLIKFLFNEGDPVSLIKANQAMNYLAKELLDYHNNGLLVYSINTILKRCYIVIRSNTVFQNIGFYHEIIKKYLKLISILIKLSKLLEMTKLYYKYIDHYGKVFDLALDAISTNHTNEKNILKSNLLFNVGGLFVEKNLLNSSIKLYKEVINIESYLEQYSFVYGASYYNISILYYVMGNIKNCDLYLNEIFEETNKYNDIVKNKKFNEDFRRFKCNLLIFSSEVNMEKENYLKAIENLKEVINELEKTSYKERHKTQQSIADKKYNNTFMKNLYNAKKNFLSSKKNNIFSKSNSLVSSMVMEFNKDKKAKPKKKTIEKSNIEYLYEINYFDDKKEKIHFNEKIKEIVNGLFDAILFMQKEKELKQKDIQYSKKKLNKKIKKNNSDKKVLKRVKSSSVVYETDGNLLDPNAKVLIGRVKRNDNKYYSCSNDRKKIRSTTIKFMTKTENHLKEKNEEVNVEEKKEENYYKPENDTRFIYEKTAQNLLSYFNDEITKKVKIINNEGDITDFKYFFILLTNLSLRQVEILNNTQNSNMPPILFKNLPIFFSRQFKNTLNPAQRNIFDKLRVLSLIRCKVLSDSNKKICVENINYNIFHANIKFNDIRLNKYTDIIKKIREVIDSVYDFQRRRSNQYNSTLKSSQTEISQDNNSQNNNTNKQTNIIKKYITKKSKQIQKSEINSSDSSEDVGSKDNEYNDDNDGNYDNDKDNIYYFKYKNKFDLTKFKNNLIEEINYSYMIYSQDEIDNMILLIKSPIFIQMLNALELKDIKELEKDNSLMIELLKKEIKRIEQSQIEQIQKKDSIVSSESSINEIDINIDEKDLENKKLIKHKLSLDFSSFRPFQNKLREINKNKKHGGDKEQLDLFLNLNKYHLEKRQINDNNFCNILRTSTNVSILSKKDLDN